MLGAFIATQSREALCSVCMVTDSAVAKRQQLYQGAVQRGVT